MAIESGTLNATAILRGLVQKIHSWAIARRNAALLLAQTPDQREDLGLTLRDLSRLGA